VEHPTAATGVQPRMYGCAKCGTPFPAYPPDDVHIKSSRQSSSFLETIETSLVCSKCNEVTRLYWGRPVFYRGIVVGLRRLSTLTTPIVQRLFRIRIGKSQGEEGHEIPQEHSDSDSAESVDDKIYEYIQSKGGAIGIRSASEDLRVPAEVIREAIERMTMEGRLKA